MKEQLFKVVSSLVLIDLLSDMYIDFKQAVTVLCNLYIHK